jgi:hypothetical protein
MQENQHSKHQISLNVDKALFVEHHDRDETPNTVDTSKHTSSAFKSMAHMSNSKRSSGVSIVG